MANHGRAVGIYVFPNILNNFTPHYPYWNTQNKQEIENIVSPSLFTFTSLYDKALDRKKCKTKPTMVKPLTKWKSNANNRRITTGNFDMESEIKADSTNRKEITKVILTFTAAIANPVYLPIIVIEKHLISPQLTPRWIEQKYKHYHVLRKSIARYKKIGFAQSIEAGRVNEKV